MTNAVEVGPVLSFLGDLGKHNDRTWFESHRSDYETAYARFEDLVAALIIEISKFDDLGGVAPKDCIFRIYRDVRFSKDKSPYKTNMGALIGPGGRRTARFAYYVHVAPGNHSMLAGGCYDPTSEQLAKWREEVDRDSSAVKKIIHRRDFAAAFGGLAGERLAKAPRGYPADHPDLDLLRLKTITVTHAVTDRELVAPGVVEKSAAIYRTMKPFLACLDSILPHAAEAVRGGGRPAKKSARGRRAE